jgi:hypothetical protein
MSLAPGEQRTLVVIEGQLRGSNPGLVALFGLLAADGAMNRLVRRCLRGCGRGPGGRPPLIARLVAGLALFAVRLAGALDESLRIGLPWDVYALGMGAADPRFPQD